jgi:hypothetical protein
MNKDTVYIITDIHSTDTFYGDNDLIGRKVTFNVGLQIWESNLMTPTKGWAWGDCVVEGRPDAYCFHAIKVVPVEPEKSLWQKLVTWSW